MNCESEVKKRVDWIKSILKDSGAKGIVYGNSGGKDCTLCGILCKMATDNVLSVIMPCESSVNFGKDREDALTVAKQFNIETLEADLTCVKKELKNVLEPILGENKKDAFININPRLRMTLLYSVAQSRGYIVCGTGNLSEYATGYFTKWGDGAYDFNPIGDLTVTEIYELLKFLNAPESIIDKAPSAGLYEGQTDEKEMGISYKDIDNFLKGKPCENKDLIIKKIKASEHKRKPVPVYGKRDIKLP